MNKYKIVPKKQQKIYSFILAYFRNEKFMS